MNNRLFRTRACIYVDIYLLYIYVCTHRQFEKTLGGLGYVHILQGRRERHEIINVKGKYAANVRKGCLRERFREEADMP